MFVTVRALSTVLGRMGTDGLGLLSEFTMVAEEEVVCNSLDKAKLRDSNRDRFSTSSELGTCLGVNVKDETKGNKQSVDHFMTEAEQ
jgi:hypothetical protein